MQGQLQAYFIWRQSAARGSSSCRNRRICAWHQLIRRQTEWRRRWKARIRCRLWPQDVKMCSDWYLTKNLFQLATCLGGWGHWLFTFLLGWFVFFLTDLRLNAVLVCQWKPFNRLQRGPLGRLRFDQLHSFGITPCRAVYDGSRFIQNCISSNDITPPTFTCMYPKIDRQDSIHVTAPQEVSQN